MTITPGILHGETREDERGPIESTGYVHGDGSIEGIALDAVGR